MTMSEENIEQPTEQKLDGMVKIIFTDEVSKVLAIDKDGIYSAIDLIKLFEETLDETDEMEITMLDSLRYNIESCQRGDLRVLVNHEVKSVSSLSISDGSIVGFAKTQKNA
jgi:hypothetical protein